MKSAVRFPRIGGRTAFFVVPTFVTAVVDFATIQVIAMLFGSCGYRSAYYYDPYSYRDYSYSNSGSYANQNQTDGNTSSGSWY